MLQSAQQNDMRAARSLRLVWRLTLLRMRGVTALFISLCLLLGWLLQGRRVAGTPVRMWTCGDHGVCLLACVQVENEDLVFTLETMVEKFGDEIAPYAVSCLLELGGTVMSPAQAPTMRAVAFLSNIFPASSNRPGGWK